MMFLHKWGHLAEITKGKHHTHSRDEHGQFKRNGNECGKRKVRFASNIQWPVCREHPTHSTERDGGARDTVDETRCVKACLLQPDRMIETMHCKRSIHVMDLIPASRTFFTAGNKTSSSSKQATTNFFFAICDPAFGGDFTLSNINAHTHARTLLTISLQYAPSCPCSFRQTPLIYV